MASKGRPYRTYVVEGFEILVGRGNVENDHLTMEVAQPGDLWLHAGGGTPGSHVVIRNPDGAAMPRSVLEAAAGLAAWFSKARDRAHVEVDYCDARNVHKPRGAPAGLVEIRNHKRIKVRPAVPDARVCP